MRVLISPEASAIINQGLTTDGTNQAVAEAIRHDLDRLRTNEYFFCTHKGAASAVTTFGGTSLGLYYNANKQIAVLFDTTGLPRRLGQEFFETLIPSCTDFNVL